MSDKSIKKLADEILQFRGKCNVDVNAISKQLMGLDDTLSKYQAHKQIKRDQPKGA